MNKTHHAILYRTDSTCSFELPQDNHNSEIDNFYTEKFGVDDARELIRKANNRPVEAEYLLLVVRTNFITLEAQNALLKVLEEPPLSTFFVFVIPYDLTVLPTLTSRFNSQSEREMNVEQSKNENFDAFVDQIYKDRLANIDQAIKNKDVEWQRSIKQGLIQFLKQQKNISHNSLQELEFVARLLLTRGASNKMLFEHVALIL